MIIKRINHKILASNITKEEIKEIQRIKNSLSCIHLWYCNPLSKTDINKILYLQNRNNDFTYASIKIVVHIRKIDLYKCIDVFNKKKDRINHNKMHNLQFTHTPYEVFSLGRKHYVSIHLRFDTYNKIPAVCIDDYKLGRV